MKESARRRGVGVARGVSRSAPLDGWRSYPKARCGNRGVAVALRAKTHRLLPVRCCHKKEGSRGPGGVARGSQKFPRLRKFYPDAPYSDSGNGLSKGEISTVVVARACLWKCEKFEFADRLHCRRQASRGHE